MISSIEISGFRGIREGKLEALSPLTVLVGPNGCGKSSVLDAMLIGASPMPAVAVYQVVRRHRGVVERGRWLFWQREGMPREAKCTVRTEKQTERTSVLKLLKEPSSPGESLEESAIQCATTWRGATNGNDARNVTHLSPTGDNVQAWPVPALDGVSNIGLVEVDGSGGQQSLHDLFLKSTRSGQSESTKALIAELVPGLKNVEILTEAGKPILYLVFESGAVPVALSGDGVHAAVRVASNSPPCQTAWRCSKSQRFISIPGDASDDPCDPGGGPTRHPGRSDHP